MSYFERIYNLFFNPGEVTEIRAFGLSKGSNAWEGWTGGAGIVYGYFDNPKDFAKAAAAMEQARAVGIYFTLNPVIPDLLARAVNRLKAAGAKSITTSDKDILCIRWLPIDLDPKRPAGISSTDEELKSTRMLRNKIAAALAKEFKIHPGIPAISGNGAHLVYRLPDLKNTDENKKLIRQSLKAIHFKFQSEKVDVDLSVFNPARIWKLYGTTARKGDHIQSRPHRRSYISEKHFKHPLSLSDIETNKIEILELLANQAPKREDKNAPPTLSKGKNNDSGTSRKADLGHRY